MMAVAAARWLQAALDVLLVALVGLAVVSAYADLEPPRGAAALGAGLALLGGYVLGRIRIRVRDAGVDAPRGLWWPHVAWTAWLVATWAVLLGITPAALWIAFPLMFLEMHVLGPRRGVLAVALTTALAVAGALAASFAPVGAVLGPVIGGAVAVTVVLGLEAVVRESQARQALIVDLVATRADLARTEHARAVVAERERLAREIHDTLAQGFSSIELLLRAADAALERGDVAGARRHVTTSREAAHANLAESRRFVADLAPPDLARGNLVAALERVAARVPEHGGPPVDVRVSGEPRALPAAAEAALLRVAQSALANVTQHARAGRARLTISYLDDGVALDVVDDGLGFDPAARAADGGSFGLRAMRSRLAELGGVLTVESAPGEGTALAVHLPLDAEEPT
ncbi:histidine kinase [Beutenbergia cavernae DSM 12333]|uniref:Oxygen sensor histidine kinase NreB n=1 Tax=Beutenbergia cavernae (strain ATCC BAA-8 / DSM 12333 / CCUG 43141 / JCM 11478 / NBRC 16432 / NCIMB 13614 / HKI 0122) TaxID=471853 RepID=C5BWR7_BEUC1|nr:histidine kinase [Beutenbergia cavernae DSM 12333]